MSFTLTSKNNERTTPNGPWRHIIEMASWEGNTGIDEKRLEALMRSDGGKITKAEARAIAFAVRVRCADMLALVDWVEDNAPTPIKVL